jgi:GT2 family glycosyltransferase
MAEQPFFSVVVPTRARPERLRACLQGLSELGFPADRFEVVVSDDGSPVSPEPVVTPFRERLRLRLVVGPNAGPGAARNRGAARATGRYLAFVDDDCVPAPDWLTALERRFAAAPDALIGGGIVNGLPGNPFSTATQLIVSYVYDYYERTRPEVRFFNTSNLAVPAPRFRERGGFSEDFSIAAEDYDFCHRWQHTGGRTVYAPEALVHHAHHLTLRGFWRQHFAYGRGLYTCRLRIAQRTGQRLRGEAAGFYLDLLRFPLTRDGGARRWLHSALVVTSQLATAAGAAREATALAWSGRRSAPASVSITHETGAV